MTDSSMTANALSLNIMLPSFQIFQLSAFLNRCITCTTRNILGHACFFYALRNFLRHVSQE